MPKFLPKILIFWLVFFVGNGVWGIVFEENMQAQTEENLDFTSTQQETTRLNNDRGEGGTTGDPGGGGTESDTFSLPNPLGSDVNSITALIQKIARFLTDTIVPPLAAIMIIWAGFLFITAQGNEEKITRAKKNFLYTAIGVAVVYASTLLVDYITGLLGAPESASRSSALMTRLGGTLTAIEGLIFALALLFFLWGVVQYIGAGGDEEKLKIGKRHMLYGIIGLGIMFSVWGIVNMIAGYVIVE